MDRTVIRPYGELNRQIYGYILPEVPSHEGYVKVGDTTGEVKKRVDQQVGTAGLTPEILFERIARRSDGTWFRDKSLHRFFELSGIEKAKLGTATEWFFFNGELEKAEALTDKYISLDYDEIQIDENTSGYVLRDEQSRAVESTFTYYNSGQEPREFLWNAKPRFGKTLSSYDFVRRIKATNVLIVTNRPAIANSWFDDFQRFIAWQEPGMKFISDTEALKGKAMSREEFHEYIDSTKHENPSQITFLSLQDLKGAKFFGGSYDKLEWVGGLNWDLLIIDEAHEGVDTVLTDTAFDKIERKFTLHLSGTPFKALASNKFSEQQIFNWSYVDEQSAKENWDYSNGDNPYERLPQLNLFTYQMSKMIEERVSKGLTLGDAENVDFAFDLNEFFRVKDNGEFEYEDSVEKFLDNLSSGHFPFSEGNHRDELNHTFWLLPRVNSAKALEVMLRRHPVFSEYEIVLAAGDGVRVDHDSTEEAADFRKNERSLSKVRAAIKNSKKTITLSVGQLTTGVTIPEWSAVLMLNNIKSPSLYFQAAFRAQNPYEFPRDGKLFRKENAYIFDFAPERTLRLFDEFANNLSGEGSRTDHGRVEGIKALLNFFPVIGEDEEGNMHELDATEVLIIPTRITSKQVVKQGFMSNLLFANISGIFAGHSQFKEILDKIRPEKNKRLGEQKDVIVTNPMLGDDGNVVIPQKIVINTTNDIFGPAIYRVLETVDIPDFGDACAVNEIEQKLDSGFDRFKATFDLTKAQTDKVKEEVGTDLIEIIQKTAEAYQNEVRIITDNFAQQIQEAEGLGDEVKVAVLNALLDEEKAKVDEVFTANLNAEVGSTIEAAVEKEIEKVEEFKKKTTEDDVRDHLRGFARTIPAFLMAYGDKNTTLADFEKNIDEPTFEELTNITVDEFKQLRDGFDFIDDDGNNRRVPGLFNEVVFNASINEFFATKERLSNYFDEKLTEDIFSYIPPQKTNQIFTPRRVVKMMVDMVERTRPGIFTDYNSKFIDLYSKSGLYVTEIAQRLNEGLKKQIPDHKDRIKWILENQVYALAPSNIIYNIIRNFVYPDAVGVSTRNLIELDLTQYIDKPYWQERVAEAFGGEDMKFDVIIGNPPYQLEDGGAKASAGPLYHKFVKMAKDLDPNLISLIIPTRWYVGGKGLDEFREQMLKDKHLRELHDWLTPDDIFPNTNIRGGVCYFLWEKNYNNHIDLARVVTYQQNKIIDDAMRPIAIGGADIFIRDNRAFPILAKVSKDETIESLQEHVSSRRPFGLEGYVSRDEKFRSKNNGLIDPVTCYGKGMAVGYLERKDIVVRPEWIDNWKVFTPRANNIGTELNDDNLNTFIGAPGTICTESYLAIGAELGLEEDSARNLSTYLTTKFARYLHSLAKASHDATAKTYRFVPLQDFSSSSDIDWSSSVKDVDEQLYRKYGLSDEEIQHIEGKIKSMEIE